MIFVFGSNLRGVHGAGAAKVAQMQHGAIPGYGFGPAGNSFAIPTKDEKIRTLDHDRIRVYVENFIAYSWAHPHLIFQVTCIGCGLAGYADRDIAPLFLPSAQNCQFDAKWRPYLGAGFTYWGTYG